jgi:hypothetical protein
MVSPGFLLSLWLFVLPQRAAVAQSLAEAKKPPAATIGKPVTLEQIENTPPAGWPGGLPLPSGAFSWDFLGDFKLSSGGPEQQVKLYLHDIRSQEKFFLRRMGEEGDCAATAYNPLFLEAVFRDVNGGWHHTQLETFLWADFSWIRQISTHEITLGFRGINLVNVFGTPIQQVRCRDRTKTDQEQIQEWLGPKNCPFTRTLILKNGEPTLE